MKKKLIVFISILLFILLFVVIVFITNYIIKFDSNKKIEVELYKCIDGDTVWLERDNKKLKYRLLAIDTPELNEEYGNDSNEYVCNILNNANIILAFIIISFAPIYTNITAIIRLIKGPAIAIMILFFSVFSKLLNIIPIPNG